jgi:hypothetical protein
VISPVITMLFVVGLFVWLFLNPESAKPAKLFLFVVGVVLFGAVAKVVMDAEAAAFPLKFDYHLYLIDRSLGLSAFAIARRIPRFHALLFVIYETLGYWMILLYGVHLNRTGGRPRELLLSYLISYGLAPIVYLIVPACGPRHAFAGLFPMGAPDVTPVAAPLAFWPNAIPSLHLTTAILFVYFAGPSRFAKTMTWLYLAGTAGATLVFEHYSIDLVVAVPYAYLAIALAEGRLSAAARNLGVVLAWLFSIRFATPAYMAHPLLTRALAAATVLAPAVNAPVPRWRTLSWKRAGAAPTPVPSTLSDAL